MKSLLLIFISAFSSNLMATVWHIGSTQTYTKPSDVVNFVQNGDTIEIDGGVYLNDASKWTKKNLKFFGLGTGTNRTILQFNTDIPNGKGIFVFETPGNCDNPYLENIVFDGAQISDGNGANGAGIRFQAKDIAINNCRFVNCQNGILEGHGSVSTSNVTITNSEFENNGYQIQNDPTHSGYEHHIYISASTDTLLVQNCYFHHPRGQANSLKTRAQRNYILYNYIDEGDTGYGSYELNIAQGGLCVIMGNVIIQGSSGANHAVVGYDAATNALQDFYFVNNTVINHYNGNMKYFNISPSTGINTFKVYNNIFGSVPGAGISFFGANTPSVLDSMSNIISSTISSLQFINTSSGDFHLLPSSPVMSQAVNAGLTNTGYPLSPIWMYENFTSPLAPRMIWGAGMEIGAYEIPSAIGISEPKINDETIIYPNPSKGKFYIFNPTHNFYKIEVSNINGSIVLQSAYSNEIDLSHSPVGIYYVKLIFNDEVIVRELVVN